VLTVPSTISDRYCNNRLNSILIAINNNNPANARFSLMTGRACATLAPQPAVSMLLRENGRQRRNINKSYRTIRQAADPSPRYDISHRPCKCNRETDGSGSANSTVDRHTTPEQKRYRQRPPANSHHARNDTNHCPPGKHAKRPRQDFFWLWLGIHQHLNAHHTGKHNKKPL
jgi:hypothetical protein